MRCVRTKLLCEAHMTPRPLQRQNQTRRPTYETTSHFSHNFGVTDFPFFTNKCGPNLFVFFASTSHRPLVHREALGANVAQSAQEIQRYPSRPPLENSPTPLWEAELSRHSPVQRVAWTWLSSERPAKVHVLPEAEQGHEKVLAVLQGKVIVRTAKPSVSEIIALPRDVVFLPPGWDVCALAVTTPSTENVPTIAVLRTYSTPLRRNGHFVKGEFFKAQLESEEDFLRKKIRKEMRWDEVMTGPRKVF